MFGRLFTSPVHGPHTLVLRRISWLGRRRSQRSTVEEPLPVLPTGQRRHGRSVRAPDPRLGTHETSKYPQPLGAQFAHLCLVEAADPDTLLGGIGDHRCICAGAGWLIPVLSYSPRENPPAPPRLGCRI